MSVDWPSKPAEGWWIRMRRVRQRRALALRARRQQQRAHRHRHADAHRRDVGLDELHRVVDREARVDAAAGRVDVDRDVLVGILALQVQQLGDDEVRDLVVDRRAEEDDPLVEQPRVDVELALAARGALDDHRDQRHGRHPSAPGEPEPGRSYPLAGVDRARWPHVRVVAPCARDVADGLHDDTPHALPLRTCAACRRRSPLRAASRLAAPGGGDDQPRRLAARDQHLVMDKGPGGADATCCTGRRDVHNYLLGGYGNDTIYGGNAGDVIWGDYHPSGWPVAPDRGHPRRQRPELHLRQRHRQLRVDRHQPGHRRARPRGLRRDPLRKPAASSSSRATTRCRTTSSTAAAHQLLLGRLLTAACRARGSQRLTVRMPSAS